MCADVRKIILDSVAQGAVSIDYYCSPFSDADRFSEILGEQVKAIDIKSPEVVPMLREKYDLVFSIHCKQIFPKALVEQIRCINLHPGYNPINKGWYPQVFAIIKDLPLGATLHEMSETLDAGPIIDRKLVPLHHWDNSKSAYDKVVAAELEIFRDNIRPILQGEYETFVGDETPQLHMLRDFKALQQLDLDKQVSYRQVIDHLRALTHPLQQRLLSG
ncbi:formyltransferase family protein [Chitinophaga caseinilytica]|uniref:Formyltransferase family protein n=1 Tax=Chitinophaga caseinilytica TaxID=2267521 RepID=A0ABZ2Z991_9BACT